MTSSLPSWLAERIAQTQVPYAAAWTVRLTRIDNSGDERVFVETSWLVSTLFDTRHEANVYALAAIKFPHIIAVSVQEA